MGRSKRARVRAGPASRRGRRRTHGGGKLAASYNLYSCLYPLCHCGSYADVLTLYADLLYPGPWYFISFDINL